jgi:mannose-6-phosphate isomerase class I
MNQPYIIPTITTNENGISIFEETDFSVHQRGGLFLTEQIGSKNFRIRKSDIGYTTDFHLAGDATFIIIQKGSLKIEMQNGDFKIFHGGDCFIAKDNLPEHIIFNNQIHGHKASVFGNEPLQAIHIKLNV